MRTFWLAVFLLVSTAASSTVGQAKRKVEKNRLLSDSLPMISIRVDKKFKYIGKFDFRIRDIALGERYVFVEARGKKVDRLFIAQFESIVPESQEVYRYNFDHASSFGSHKFRQNTFAFSNLAATAENPVGEAALTQAFLKDKGFHLQDEVMMSRFVTVPDTEKKHELILFYVENVRPTKKKLADLYSGDEDTEIWRRISQDLTKRSLAAFRVE